MRQPRRILALAALVVAPIACATIIHGTSEDVSIRSTPDSATVFVDGKPAGRTPVSFKMSRKDDHIVTFQLPGYDSLAVPVTRTVSGWFFGNILIGGLIGIAVDAISGGMYDLKPAELQSQLAKSGATARVERDRLYVVVVLQPDPNWHQIGSLRPAR